MSECKHDWAYVRLSGENDDCDICHVCSKCRAKVILEQKLAAERKRAEQAEAQCAAMLCDIDDAFTDEDSLEFSCPIEALCGEPVVLTACNPCQLRKLCEQRNEENSVEKAGTALLNRMKRTEEVLYKIKELVAEDAGKGDALCYEIYINICEALKENK